MSELRYREVQSPARTDGIGVALRRAFASGDGVEEDFTALLQRLDRNSH